MRTHQATRALIGAVMRVARWGRPSIGVKVGPEKLNAVALVPTTTGVTLGLLSPAMAVMTACAACCALPGPVLFCV